MCVRLKTLIKNQLFQINYFGDNVNTFNVQAVVLDEDWDERYSSDLKRFTKIINPNENKKYIDIEKKFYIANDSLNYYFSVPHGEGVMHRQFFVDSDFNISTGYTGTGNKVGADYLVEDKMLFKYTGIGEDDWSWGEVAQISDVRFKSEDTSYIIVSKEEVSTWKNRVKVLGIGLDEDWNEIYSTVSGEYSFLRDDYSSIQVRRVTNIEGYTVPQPYYDAYNMYYWRTKFIDILGDNAYALSNFGDSLGSLINYPFGSYLSVLDVSDMQRPILKKQFNLGDGFLSIFMYTSYNYLYIVQERYLSNRSVGVYLKIVNITDKYNPKIASSILLFGGSASNITIVKDGNLLIIKDDNHNILVDISNSTNPMKQEI